MPRTKCHKDLRRILPLCSRLSNFLQVFQGSQKDLATFCRLSNFLQVFQELLVSMNQKRKIQFYEGSPESATVC